jgi:hypothetical protein
MADQSGTTFLSTAVPTPAETTEPNPAALSKPAQSRILLRSPRKYSLAPPAEWTAPPLEWLEGTWSVTHSTLPMWRKAKNVRITYKILPGEPTLLDDTVESVPTQKSWMPQPREIKGIDAPDGEGAWAWRGKGLLRIASSRWEVLGWGQREGERWVVTWFAPSLFTPAGVDVYSSLKEGISEGLYREVGGALKQLEAKEVAELCKNEMMAVKIEY